MILSQEYVETNAALWTFDIKQRMWQQRQAAGTLPEPKFTCGLAAANDKVYLLSNTDNMEGEMMVFELDLQTWQCQLLPSIGEAPPCLAGMSLVVAEVSVSEPHARLNPSADRSHHMLCNKVQHVAVIESLLLSWATQLSCVNE